MYINAGSLLILSMFYSTITRLPSIIDKIVSEKEDKLQEEITIKKALSMCGYTKWTFDKVRKIMEGKQTNNSSKTKRIIC